MPLLPVLMIALLATHPSNHDDAGWETYRNTLFPFQVTIPRSVFPEERTYPRGDGRSYHSADGLAEVTAYGTLLDEQIFSCSAFEALPDGAIETGNAGDHERSFIWGEIDGRAIHTVVVRTDTHCLRVDVSYPATQSDRYQRLASMIQDSLKPLKISPED